MKIKIISADGKSVVSKINRMRKYLEEHSDYYIKNAGRDEFLRWADGVVRGMLNTISGIAMVVPQDPAA